MKLLKFLIIGSINTLICMILFEALILTGLNYLISSALMNIFGIIEGYLLNARFVYKTEAKIKALLKYSNVYAVSFILNLSIMYLLVTLLHQQELVAQIITTGILTIMNYFLVKIIVFA